MTHEEQSATVDQRIEAAWRDIVQLVFREIHAVATTVEEENLILASVTSRLMESINTQHLAAYLRSRYVDAAPVEQKAVQ